MARSLNEIETIFNEALQQGLKDKLRGHAPTRGSGGGPKEAYRERALHDALPQRSSKGNKHMAINLVTKFAPYTDEQFSTESKKSLLY